MKNLGGPWQIIDPTQELVWKDNRDEDRIPLLEGENGPLLNRGASLDWPGPWNVQERNLFKVDEWKPIRPVV